MKQETEHEVFTSQTQIMQLKDTGSCEKIRMFYSTFCNRNKISSPNQHNICPDNLVNTILCFKQEAV